MPSKIKGKHHWLSYRRFDVLMASVREEIHEVLWKIQIHKPLSCYLIKQRSREKMSKSESSQSIDRLPLAQNSFGAHFHGRSDGDVISYLVDADSLGGQSFDWHWYDATFHGCCLPFDRNLIDWHPDGDL